MSGKGGDRAEWLFSLKRKMTLSLFALMFLSMALTVGIVSALQWHSTIDEDRAKTGELASALQAGLRSLMLKRSPEMIHDSISAAVRPGGSIVRVMILDSGGRVAFSTDASRAGAVLDRFTDRSCTGCHKSPGSIPLEGDLLLSENGARVHRLVRVLYNEPACRSCHATAGNVVGKLIIDRSLEGSYALIRRTVLIMAGIGAICLLGFYLILSRQQSAGVNRYIGEVLHQSDEVALKTSEVARKGLELELLYSILDRLSRTIDMQELKAVAVDILAEVTGAEKISVVELGPDRHLRVSAWSWQTARLTRGKLDIADGLSVPAAEWLEGRLMGIAASLDGKEFYLPSRGMTGPLALIVITAGADSLNDKAEFFSAMGKHISTAFENARLYDIAITDELTTLFTQRHFRHVLEREFANFERYGEGLVFLMIDIDDFKKVNDKYGHLTGDAVLSGVAACLNNSIRHTDTAFRYGGEELAVLLPSTDLAEGIMVAERIRKTVMDARFATEEHQGVGVTVSIGVSACPLHGTTTHGLKLTADEAMYEAKRTGKNRVVAYRGAPIDASES